MVDASGVAVNIGYKVGSVYVCLNFRFSNAFPVVFRRTVSWSSPVLFMANPVRFRINPVIFRKIPLF